MSARRKRPMVLLHGWTMRGSTFDPLIRRLGEDFDCHAPDLPGHGAALGEPIGFEACMETLDRTLKALGREDVLLLGWSMGAAISWRYIGERGCAGLAGLITVDMSPRLVNDAAWGLGLRNQTPERTARTAERIRDDWASAGPRIVAGMFIGPAGGPDMSHEEALEIAMANDPAQTSPYWAELLAMDMRWVMPKIEIPYLATFGVQSRAYLPETSDWVAQAAPRARALGFAHSGHGPHLEEPEAFAAAVRGFEAAL